MRPGFKEADMNLKKIITGIAVKEATNKLLPMEDAKPKFGKKAKLAGVLAAVAALLTALSNYFAG